MKPLKVEVAAVAALLQEPAEDAEELATRIILEMDRVRSQRSRWVFVARYQLGSELLFMAYGPYSTQGQADKTGERLASTTTELAQGLSVSLHPAPSGTSCKRCGRSLPARASDDARPGPCEKCK